MEKIPFSKENNHSLQHQHSHSLIYCFICGIAYKQSHFISHYTECKNNYLTNPTYDTRPVQEPPNFEIFLTKIKKKRRLVLGAIESLTILFCQRRMLLTLEKHLMSIVESLNSQIMRLLKICLRK